MRIYQLLRGIAHTHSVTCLTFVTNITDQAAVQAQVAPVTVIGVAGLVLAWRIRGGARIGPQLAIGSVGLAAAFAIDTHSIQYLPESDRTLTCRAPKAPGRYGDNW
jgi:hypothetical protein